MRRKKVLVSLALLALATFTITATIVGAAANASGPVAHTAGLKKCLKKAKKIKNPVRRKKEKQRCRKKFGTTTGPASLVRATLTWSGGGDSTDYDLYVLGSNGQVATRGIDAIPASEDSPDAKGASGTETFTDLDFKSHREFQFAVCKQDGGNDGSAYHFDWVTANGAHHTDSYTGASTGYSAFYSGSSIARNVLSPCPAPI